MSLKAFHVAFITVATLLMAGIGVWGLRQGPVLLGILGLAMAAALVVYGVWFLKKMKGVGYL